MSQRSRRRHARWLALALAPLLLLGALLTASAASADPSDDIPVNANDPAPYGCTSASSGRYTTCTNDPYSTDPTTREPLLDVYIGLTESAEAGDTITIAMFNWWYRKTGDPFDYSKMQTFTHDLIDAAEDRGVTVNIALDEHSNPAFNTELDGTIDQPWDELTASTAINFVACGESDVDYSRCLENPAKTSAIQHNKLLLFNIGGVKHVVVSSANFGAAGMAQLYQNTVKVTGDNALYDFYTAYWTRLANDDWDGWTVASDRVQVGSANPANSTVETKAYVYPHPRPVDSLGNLLDDVSSCPSSGHRKIWIVGPSLSDGRMTENDDRLYDSLRALNDLGCNIRVITSERIKCSVHNTLTSTADGIEAELITLPSGTLHSKTLIVDAVSTDVQGANPAQRQFVWTGSTNHTEGIWDSANSNIRVDDHDVARKYISNFTAIWNSNNGSASTCVS